jgi:hypothetical protein
MSTADAPKRTPMKLGSPEWKAHVAAKVDTWDPIDDATRTRLRLLLTPPPAEQQRQAS